MVWVNEKSHRVRRLRGVHRTVNRGGVIRSGDSIQRV
jgi:hypothetical protein